ncbi:ribosomal RNA small subunit methyltransferase G [Lacticaseibacillus paracasei subsp. tolerans]|nr:16S rRNA (guanine(527)-N(7))-methyltransferase RsmG [Lacticaseibacillus paracasei]GEL37737.1 ribosomal RNA small subunit methyltransferase G [Lacticaseibacillus paracasei subsp. tolerans]
MDPAAFVQALADHGIVLNDHQQDQFVAYYQYLISENEKMNLTGITAEGDVYLKHFYDSLTLALVLPELQTQVMSVCDVGAGAGFPSIPLKIAFPQLKITIVDSLQKRIGFLERLTARLELTDVQLFHDRAETFGAKKSPHRASFDLVTARAVAALDVLAELCLPLVKPQGRFVAMKAAATPAELIAAKSAIGLLGGKLAQDAALTLPETGDPRHLLVIDKVKPTPNKYPRKPGIPNKQPLGGA